MDYQELFNYMAKNHDVNLLESEMQEVVIIVKRMLNNDEAPIETPNVNNNEAQRELLIAYDQWFAENTKGTIDETTEERVDWYLKAINND